MVINGGSAYLMIIYSGDCPDYYLITKQDKRYQLGKK